MDKFEKSSIMYEALEELSLELDGKALDAVMEFMAEAPIESFARLYDILMTVKGY